MSTGITPDATASASNFRGMIMLYAGTSAPTGFLMCDGSAVSRSTYSDLFTLIGTTYGVGDGSTTFNVPDLVGRLPVGSDSANSRLGADGTVGNSAALGDSGGSEVHTLTEAELASHTHNVSDTWKDGGDGSAGTGTSDQTNTMPATITSTSAGSDNPHQNMPPYQTVNYIIKH